MFVEDLVLGQTAEATHVVSDQTVHAYAAVSTDENPLHLDEAFARATSMKGRVVHGMLLGGYISAVIGTKLPGAGTIYLSQTLRFKRPVRIGDEVVVRVEVRAIDGADVSLFTQCKVGGKAVVDGEALVRAPRRSQDGAA